MRRPPRRPTERLFSLTAVTLAVLQGVSLFIAVWLLYGLVLNWGIVETEARAIAFACVVFGNIGLILANLSKTKSIVAVLTVPNTALRWVIGGTLCGLVAALYTPGVRDLFRFSSPSPIGLLLSFATAAMGLVWYEIYKRWLRQRPA